MSDRTVVVRRVRKPVDETGISVEVEKKGDDKNGESLANQG